MSALRRLVLDVLTPHEPTTIDLAEAVADVDGITGVNVTLVEIDKEVENVKLTVEGDAIDYDQVRSIVVDHGGTVHSIDEVATGKDLVEASETPQDG